MGLFTKIGYWYNSWAFIVKCVFDVFLFVLCVLCIVLYSNILYHYYATELYYLFLFMPHILSIFFIWHLSSQIGKNCSESAQLIGILSCVLVFSFTNVGVIHWAVKSYPHFQLIQPIQLDNPWIETHMDTSHIRKPHNFAYPDDSLNSSSVLNIADFELLRPVGAACYYAQHWQEGGGLADRFEQMLKGYVRYLDYETLKSIHDLLVDTPLQNCVDSAYVVSRDELLSEIRADIDSQRRKYIDYFRNEVAINVKLASDTVLFKQVEQLVDHYNGFFLIGHYELLLGRGENYMAHMWGDYVGKDTYTQRTAFINYIEIFNRSIARFRNEYYQTYLPGIRFNYSINSASFKFLYPYTTNIAGAVKSFVRKSSIENVKDIALDAVGFIPVVGPYIDASAMAWTIYNTLSSEEASPEDIFKAALVAFCYDIIQEEFDKQSELLETLLESEDDSLYQLIADSL